MKPKSELQKFFESSELMILKGSAKIVIPASVAKKHLKESAQLRRADTIGKLIKSLSK